jgi:hypothetical protein
VITGGYFPDQLTDLFHDTGSLVTANRGKRRWQLSISARDVSVADADRDNPDEHVCVPEIREFDVFQTERATQAMRDGGCTSHGFSESHGEHHS